MAAPEDEADCPPRGDRSATIRGRAGAAVEGPEDGVAAVEVDAVLSEVSALVGVVVWTDRGVCSSAARGGGVGSGRYPPSGGVDPW